MLWHKHRRWQADWKRRVACAGTVTGYLGKPPTCRGEVTVDRAVTHFCRRSLCSDFPRMEETSMPR